MLAERRVTVEQDISAVLRGMIGALKNQNIVLQGLHDRLHELEAALAMAFSSPENEHRQQPVNDPEVIARTDAGIAELEKMFRQDDEKKGGS